MSHIFWFSALFRAFSTLLGMLIFGEFSSALIASPSASHLLQAQDALSVEEPNLAEVYLQAIDFASLSPLQQAQYHYLYALVERVHNNLQAAKEHLQQAKQLSPSQELSAAIIYQQALLATETGDLSAAQQLIHEVKQFDLKAFEALLIEQSVRLSLANQQFSQALNELEKTLVKQELSSTQKKKLCKLISYLQQQHGPSLLSKERLQQAALDPVQDSSLLLAFGWQELERARHLPKELRQESLLSAQAIFHLLQEGPYPLQAELGLIYAEALLEKEGKINPSSLQAVSMKRPVAIIFANIIDSDLQAHLLVQQASRAMEQKEWQAAAEKLQLAMRWTDPGQHPEATYQLAECYREMGNEELAKKEFQSFYQNFPHHTLTAEAYFRVYPHSAYVKHDPLASKHLKQLIGLYSKDPIAIEAYYLLALERKSLYRDPKSNKLHHPNWPEAIEIYLKAEDLFNTLNEVQQLPDTLVSYYTLLDKRSKLDRALCHLAIAKESSGWKRALFLDYAREILVALINEHLNAMTTQEMQEQRDNLSLEAHLLLADILLLEGESKQALELLEPIAQRLQLASQPKSQFIHQYHRQLGSVAFEMGEVIKAKEHLSLAEAAMQNQSWADGSQLDLWLQQGVCCRILNEPEAAMRLFSAIINFPISSPELPQALYHRALLFWETGRPLLAKRQLERLANREGEWALLAKQQLEKIDAIKP